MQDHYNCHNQSHNMHEARRALEDNRVRELDVPRVAICLDPYAEFDIRDAADDRAEGKCCLVAEPVEVAECHLGGIMFVATV
jgi:hypothetical protein